MIEEHKNRLREILVAGENSWRPMLVDFLAPMGSDPAALSEIRTFLSDKAASAAKVFLPRMKGMMDMVAAAICKAGVTPEVIDGLASEILDLMKRVKSLEETVAEKKLALAALIGENMSWTGPVHFVKTSAGGPNLKIVAADRVPPDFLKPQPDRKAILNHFKATGRTIPGAEITARRPSVMIKRKGEGTNGDCDE